jgi:hypothetical protein
MKKLLSNEKKNVGLKIATSDSAAPLVRTGVVFIADDDDGSPTNPRIGPLSRYHQQMDLCRVFRAPNIEPLQVETNSY